MGRRSFALDEARRVGIAGRMVLRALRNVPDSATAEMMRELIAMTVDDPDARALFRSLGRGGAAGEASPVTSPRSPVLSGGAAVRI